MSIVEQKTADDSTDRELVSKLARNGDSRTFAAVVDRYGPLVMGVCQRLSRDQHDAEDSFQATFLVFAQSLKKIRRPESLASWLYGVAYRVSLRINRKRLKREAQLDEEPAVMAEDPFEVLSRRFAHQKTDEELNRLPESLRIPMVLRYLMDKSNDQIARELGLSVSAIEGRLKRAKARLRVRLMRHGITLGLWVTALRASQQSAWAGMSPSLRASIAEQFASFASSGVQVNPIASSGGQHILQMAREEITNMAIMSGTKFLAAIGGTAAVVTIGFVLQSALPGIAVGEGAGSGDIVVQVVAPDQPDEKTPAVTIAESGGDRVAPQGPTKKESVAPQSKPSQIRSARGSTLADFGFVDVMRQPWQSQKILAALDSDTKIELSGSTFGEMIDYLKQLHEINIEADNSALTDLGLTTESPVADMALQGVSLSDGLEIILGQMQLDYAVKNSVLWITSAERASGYLETHVYRLDESLGVTADELAKSIIPKIVTPDSWDEVGGEGSIATYSGGIIVSSTFRVQRRIHELLEQLGTANRSP